MNSLERKDSSDVHTSILSQAISRDMMGQRERIATLDPMTPRDRKFAFRISILDTWRRGIPRLVDGKVASLSTAMYLG